MLTEQQREDLLVTALEGGSNYWYWLGDEATKIIIDNNPDKSEPLITRMWEAIQAGKTIEIHDVEDNNEKLGEISLQSIEEGEKLMYEKAPTHFGNILNESWDAETADVWFQFCVLKDIVYG